jgi:ribosomal-protein-alanine N-acetyltransferase
LTGARIELRRPGARDRSAFLALVRASRALHRGRVAPASNALAYAVWLRRLRGDRHVGYLAIRRADGAIAGVVNLNELVWGSFRSAYLGYFADARLAGHGYMREAVALALDRAFGPIGLHRVEANIQPDNRSSLALVSALGFRREGYSPRYLKVGGRWRDHERWALLREEWRAHRPAVARPG